MEAFGTIEETLPNGLFASSLTWILEVLPFLKANNVYPNWSINTECYGHIIPAIIKPKKIAPISDRKEKLRTIKSKYGYPYKETDCQNAHDIFHEYFEIADDILQIVESLSSHFKTKTVGVHFRGTDKLNREADYISKEDVIKNVVSFLSKSPEYNTIFVAADEEDFIEKFIKEFSNKRYTILITKSLRTKTIHPIHATNTGIERAKEAMIDSLLLSKCDFVIKTSSCLSDWVKIWNPSIVVYNLNRFKEDWFPQAIIPVRSFI
jgi:hypothetical protein